MGYGAAITVLGTVVILVAVFFLAPVWGPALGRFLAGLRNRAAAGEKSFQKQYKKKK